MLNLFGRGKDGNDVADNPPVDIKWARNAKGRFHNLVFLDTTSENLNGTAGIYVIWHGGAQPKWLYVGVTKNLARVLDAKIDDPEIESYYERVGVYVSWSLVKPEYHKNIAHYLNGIMKPEIKNPDAKSWAKEKPTAVFLPGKEKVAD